MTDNINHFFNDLLEKLAVDKRFSVFNYSIKNIKDGFEIFLKISDVKLKKVVKKLFNLYFQDLLEKPKLKIQVLPHKQFEEKPFAIANSGFVPMYKNPTNTSEIINQIFLGEVCRLLDISEDWVLIKLQKDGYLGWVNIRSLERFSEQEIKKLSAQKKIIIIKKKAEIKELPDIKSTSLRAGYLGVKLIYLRRKAGWFSVLLPDNTPGWINIDDAVIYKEGKPKSKKKILKTAKMFLGSSYLWGGRNADGIDCSGFVQAVFSFNGYELPRDSSLQMRKGISIGKDFNEFLPCDLLFFGNDEKKITHVAIYTGEEKNIIHSSGYVRLNSLDEKNKFYDERLHKTFIKAVRVIN